MDLVHPAVDIVARTEGLWQDDKRIAQDRAMLIVQRLIETGHLAGRVSRTVPLAPMRLTQFNDISRPS
jgi:hypothetical protein